MRSRQRRSGLGPVNAAPCRRSSAYYRATPSTTRTTAIRPYAELRFQSPGSSSSLQRPDVHAEFPRQLGERQQLALLGPGGDSFTRPDAHVIGRETQPAVPHAQCVEGNAEKVGQFSLRQTGTAAKFAQLAHDLTLPFGARNAKRPPAYLAEGRS